MTFNTIPSPFSQEHLISPNCAYSQHPTTSVHGRSVFPDFAFSTAVAPLLSFFKATLFFPPCPAVFSQYATVAVQS
jgi:hypothetical protein